MGKSVISNKSDKKPASAGFFMAEINFRNVSLGRMDQSARTIGI
jgi:hypothetical protein